VLHNAVGEVEVDSRSPGGHCDPFVRSPAEARTKELRDLVRSFVVDMVDVTWVQNSADKTYFTLSAVSEVRCVNGEKPREVVAG